MKLDKPSLLGLWWHYTTIHNIFSYSTPTILAEIIKLTEQIRDRRQYQMVPSTNLY